MSTFAVLRGLQLRSENHSISLPIACSHLPPSPQLSGPWWWEHGKTPALLRSTHSLHYLTGHSEFDGIAGEAWPRCRTASGFGRWTGSALGIPGPEKQGIQHGQGQGGRWLSSLQSLWQALSFREALAWAGEIAGGQD